MPESLTFSVGGDFCGIRADKFLTAKMEGYSRSGIQHLFDSGNVTCDGRIISKNYKCCLSDKIDVTVPDAVSIEAKPQNIPVDIVYEDDYLLVVNKPKGMVVHPANGNPDSTLVNALLYHCQGSLSGINGVVRPGIVHRIDKDTSGLLVVAKTDKAHIGLAEQISEHSFLREYRAVVYGNIKTDGGTVDRPIGRDPSDRKKMAVVYKNSKPAVTHYSVVERYGDFTHISCRLETGRTHQIRVHMASIGHPVAGDAVYGPRRVITSLGGQCLHAKKIGFVHPITGENLRFDSELPDYFINFVNKLNKS